MTLTKFSIDINDRRRMPLRKKVLIGAIAIIVSILLVAGLYYGFFNQKETSNASQKASSGASQKNGRASRAAVVANGHECAAIGAKILRAGGSAADATIATLFCEGVTCPQSMGLGGGFILTIYDKAKNRVETLNARETAPAAATIDMLVEDDESPKDKDRRGLLIAVPGELKGYWVLHQRYGKLDWPNLVQPTINLCRNGHMVTPYLDRILRITQKKILAEPSLREIFIDPATNATWKEGQYIKRLALADSLEIIAKEGVHALYSKNGTLLPKLMRDLKGFDSILTEEDFYNYEPKWQRPVTVTLRGGSEVHSFPIPGSGTLLNLMLRVLNGYENLDLNDSLTWHRIVEAFKWAYGLRTRLGDPHYVTGIEGLMRNLTSDDFAAYIRSKISESRTFSNYSDYGAEFSNVEDHGTAHVSVLAENGDAVAATSTINYLLGAKIRSKLTGIVLNDEMDDFGTPNSTNVYGLPPSPANMIAPGKRPLSSMAPTIVTSGDGSGVRMVVGGAGGSRITTATALLILRHIVFGEELPAAMAAPRLHHQLAPMAVEYEPGFDETILDGLRRRGHVAKEKAPDAGFAAATAISRDAKNQVSGAFDPRRGGSLEIL